MIPSREELVGENGSTRRRKSRKISRRVIGRCFENHPLEEFGERMMQTKNEYCFGGDQIQRKETNNLSLH